MKTFITFLITSFVCLLSLTVAVNAQCVSPELKFANPVLVAGTALSEGAIYKFPNITAGVDCYIKLAKFNGGATLISMETPGQGYPDAWQPIIKGPGTPIGNKSWIDWEVSFKATDGSNYSFPCLDISAIDVDGDNAIIGEFVESDGHTNYTIPSPTFLTLTDMGSGRIEAQAPVINRPSIDTSALDVRISFLYNGLEKIQLKLGSTVYGVGAGATERLNCIYFKRIVTDSYFVVPVKFISFKGTAMGNKVDLNWSTDNEVYNSHYVVERSFDGVNFSTLAVVLDALATDGTSKLYQMTDGAKILNEKRLVYYRLKQVDVKGQSEYSSTIAVKLQPSNTIGLEVSPNPFNSNLKLQFTSQESGCGTVRLQQVTGQVVANKNFTVNKGSNTLQLDQLDGLSRGIYVAQVSVNGVVTGNQKIVRN